MPRKSKLGTITLQVGAEPTESDIVVGNVFARLGFDIEFIAASRKYMVHTPDIYMDGLAWEIKCIESDRMDKVRRNISDALDQSSNIIIGTFRTNILDDKIISYMTRRFANIKHIKRLKVVTKTHRVVDIK